MARALIHGLGFLAVMLAAGCVQPPPPERVTPGPMAMQIMKERVSVVLVAKHESISDWGNRCFSKMAGREDMDGGSAAPISPDGYFLTADHVLSRLGDGWNVFVIYRWSADLPSAKARVVWRSESADLALVHVPIKTPYFYRWSPPGRWAPEGTEIVHGGIATGFRSEPGKLLSSLAPESRFSRTRGFKMDIPLQPGDSGGPVVDAYGGLIGINSSVEFLVPMDTAFFVDSEGRRPNTRLIEKLINRDRLRNSGLGPDVE